MIQHLTQNPLKSNRFSPLLSRLFVIAIALLTLLMTSCSPSTARTAEQRTFLDLSVDFFKEYMSGNLTLGYTFLPKDKLTPYVYGGIGRIFDIRTPDPDLTEDTSGLNLQYGLYERE